MVVQHNISALSTIKNPVLSKRISDLSNTREKLAQPSYTSEDNKVCFQVRNKRYNPIDGDDMPGVLVFDPITHIIWVNGEPYPNSDIVGISNKATVNPYSLNDGIPVLNLLYDSNNNDVVRTYQYKDVPNSVVINTFGLSNKVTETTDGIEINSTPVTTDLQLYTNGNAFVKSAVWLGNHIYDYGVLDTYDDVITAKALCYYTKNTYDDYTNISVNLKYDTSEQKWKMYDINGIYPYPEVTSFKGDLGSIGCKWVGDENDLTGLEDVWATVNGPLVQVPLEFIDGDTITITPTLQDVQENFPFATAENIKLNYSKEKNNWDVIVYETGIHYTTTTQINNDFGTNIQSLSEAEEIEVVYVPNESNYVPLIDKDGGKGNKVLVDDMTWRELVPFTLGSTTTEYEVTERDGIDGTVTDKFIQYINDYYWKLNSGTHISISGSSNFSDDCLIGVKSPVSGEWVNNLLSWCEDQGYSDIKDLNYTPHKAVVSVTNQSYIVKDSVIDSNTYNAGWFEFDGEKLIQYLDSIGLTVDADSNYSVEVHGTSLDNLDVTISGNTYTASAEDLGLTILRKSFDEFYIDFNVYIYPWIISAYDTNGYLFQLDENNDTFPTTIESELEEIKKFISNNNCNVIDTRLTFGNNPTLEVRFDSTTTYYRSVVFDELGITGFDLQQDNASLDILYKITTIENKSGLVPAPEEHNQILTSDGWKPIKDFKGVSFESDEVVASGDLANYITVTDAEEFRRRFPSGMVLSNATSGAQNSTFLLINVNDRNSDAISQFGWDTSHIYIDYHSHSYTVNDYRINQNSNVSAYGTVLIINKRTFIDWMNTLGLPSLYFIYPTDSAVEFNMIYHIRYTGSEYILYDENYTNLVSDINLEDVGITLNEEALTDSGFDLTSSFEIDLHYNKGSYEGYIEVPTNDILIYEYEDWNTYSTAVTITPEQFATLDVDWENVYKCYFVYDTKQSKWLIYEVQTNVLCGNATNPCSTSTQELILNNLFGGLTINLEQYYTDNSITQLPDISNLPIPILNVTSEGGEPVIVPGTHGLVPAPSVEDVNKYLASDGTWKNVTATVEEFNAPEEYLETISSTNFHATPTPEFIQFIKDYTGINIKEGDKIRITSEYDGFPERSYKGNVDTVINSNDIYYQPIDNIITTILTDYPDTVKAHFYSDKWVFKVGHCTIHDASNGYIGYDESEGTYSINQEILKNKLSDVFGETAYDPNTTSLIFTINSGGTTNDWEVTYGSNSDTNQSLEDWGITLLEDIDYTDSSLYSEMSLEIYSECQDFDIQALDASENVLYEHSTASTQLNFDGNDLDAVSLMLGGFGTTCTINIQSDSYNIEIPILTYYAEASVLENRGLTNISYDDPNNDDGNIVFNIIHNDSQSGIVPAPDNQNQTLTSTGWQDTNTYIESAMTAFENNYTWIGTETEYGNVNWDSSNPMMDADTGIIYHIIYVVEE